MMKGLFICLLTIFITKSVSSQNLFVVRLGLTGTGTSDEGLWFFNDTQVLEPQIFKFKNSWGFAIDLDYELIERLTVGMHMSIARTGFQLAIDDGNLVRITEDHTSHNQLIAETKYVAKPGKVFRPFFGLNAGILFSRDIQLSIKSADLNFEFINPFIYGFVAGFDHAISASNGWSIHFILRGQSFEYTTEETSITNKQTLLDQVWWMNYNHLQLGIGKRF